MQRIPRSPDGYRDEEYERKARPDFLQQKDLQGLEDLAGGGERPSNCPDRPVCQTRQAQKNNLKPVGITRQ
ncbi:MAG: hypothetical protein AAF934_01645 [Bacteroidota bacterium]